MKQREVEGLSSFPAMTVDLSFDRDDPRFLVWFIAVIASFLDVSNCVGLAPKRRDSRGVRLENPLVPRNNDKPIGNSTATTMLKDSMRTTPLFFVWTLACALKQTGESSSILGSTGAGMGAIVVGAGPLTGARVGAGSL